MSFKVGFLGRGELGYQVLQAMLQDSSITVPVIITCPHSKEFGKTQEDFRKLAEAYDIPFYFTKNINTPQWQELLQALQVDFCVALLWVNTIQAFIIESARYGFLNMHSGMLPRYRGNACANWAILNGESQFGITAHFMDPGKLDTGPIILQESFPITAQTTISDLTDLFMTQGANLAIRAIHTVQSGQVVGKIQQESDSLYCYPRLPRDGEIDWGNTADAIEKLVRAVGHPYPGAYTYFEDVKTGEIKKMKIHQASVMEASSDFCAVKGHLLKLNQGDVWAVVCGDKHLLCLEEIEIDNQKQHPKAYFRTIRQRFGLDTETLLRHFKPVNQMDDIAHHFLNNTSQLEALCEKVKKVLTRSAASLKENHQIPYNLNTFKNGSFQKNYYQWEQKERWFGIQIYQSITLHEKVCIGYWLFSEPSKAMAHRIFLSIIPDCWNPDLAAVCEKAITEVFPAHQPVLQQSQPDRTQGWYVTLDDISEERVSQIMIKLTMTLHPLLSLSPCLKP